MNEVTRVVLVYANPQDQQKGVITMLKIGENGQAQIHKRIYRDKIIEGNDLIVKKEEVETSPKD